MSDSPPTRKRKRGSAEGDDGDGSGDGGAEPTRAPGPPMPGPPAPARAPGPPAPEGTGDDGADDDEPGSKRRKAGLEFEDLYLNALPSAEMYEKSYMHREQITHIVVTATDFVVTGSSDGHVKFWKKTPIGITFVKHFGGHRGPLTALTVSQDGMLLCSAGLDGWLKVFDVIAFDMINKIKLPVVPLTAAFVSHKGVDESFVAVADAQSSAILVFDAKGGADPVHVLNIHKAPVMHIAFNVPMNACISIDAAGSIEYWSSTDFSFPDWVAFEFKSETGLYELEAAGAFATSLAVSANGKLFAVMGSDRQVRVFKFLKGKLWRKYDESLSFLNSLQKSEAANQYKLEAMDFGRRVAIERSFDKANSAIANAIIEGAQKVKADLEAMMTSTSEVPTAPTAASPEDTAEAASAAGSAAGAASAASAAAAYAGPPPIDVEAVTPLPQANCVFDESGHFLLYPTLFGIKVVNTKTNRVVRLLGKYENTERFATLALFQGRPKKAVVAGGIEIAGAAEAEDDDPTLFCAAYGKERFYLFSRREPQEADGDIMSTGRDVFNEKPRKDQLVVGVQQANLAKNAVLHTTMGDIFIQLFGGETPKAVENFTVHARSGYYDSHIFHRVIKGFMIQTGDPLGDGTGGTSIWGRDFEDEFRDSLRHDRPFTVSMANAGPNTNNSQFFITTVPCPWLDGKHTVFGRVFRGMDVVQAIERQKTNRGDRPLHDIKIVSVSTNVEVDDMN